MAITRTESVVYGVQDVALCTRFFEDFGLERVESSDSGATFRTPVNQLVHLRHASDSELPPALVAEPTLREVIWGVDSREALEGLGSDLARDREVSEAADGSIHTADESGYGIGFAIQQPVDVT